MENYSYGTSYPDSGNSSPRSREIDFENTPPWEEHPQSNNYKVKFMCSYGGKIHPRPHDNQLSYIGGETKILVADRSTKFPGLVAKLSALWDADVCFKYQLPGEELDALISVTNDDDLEHMMHEYDRLYRASSKPARLRLFLFPANQPEAARPGSFGSGEARPDRETLVDALNSGPIRTSPPPLTAAPPNNVDFLFGLERGMPQVATKVHVPIPERDIPAPVSEDRVIATDPIQRHIQDLQRLHIGGQEQAMYRRKSDDNLGGGYPGDFYVQKLPEKVPPMTGPPAVSSPAGYWPENQVPGGVYPATTPVPEHSVYMIPAPTNVYHAPMGRAVPGPTGQGYYAVQRMPPEVYRDQPPVYNVVQPVAAPPSTAVAPPTLPPKMAGYSEGFGMVRPTTAGGVGTVEAGYTQVAYDSGGGRQVFYNAPGGVVPPQYQGMAPPAGVLNQEGKVVVKTSQASM